MANPAIVTCAKDVWTLVASGITEGAIYNMSPTVPFMQTYRMGGSSAPASDVDAFPAFSDAYAPLAISAAEAIDVYMKAVGIAGSVRVDA
jgi:hypothetical protein